MRNFFLCLLQHICRRMGSCLGHSVEELNLQGLHLCAHRPVRPPHFLRSSAVSRRARAIPCSNAAHRYDRRTSIPCRNLFFSKRASLYCSWRMCFFTVFIFTPLAFLMLFPLASRMLYILGRRPTYSAIGCRTHSSSILPSTFLFTIL